MMKVLLLNILFASANVQTVSCMYHLRGQEDSGNHTRSNRKNRRLNNQYYYETESTAVLGETNLLVTDGNPLKGLLGNQRYVMPDRWYQGLKGSISIAKFGLDEIMVDDPDVVGNEAAFDWTILEKEIDNAVKYDRHYILHIFISWPGSEPRLPPYLIEDKGLPVWYDPVKAMYLPDFTSDILLTAIEQYIRALAARYDGDKRLGFIQLGLLGYWGEWHLLQNTEALPEWVKAKVAGIYADAFKKTKLIARYPKTYTLIDNQFGIHDSSYAKNTLDGEADGGSSFPWYTWPSVQKLGVEDFWRVGVVGGENRPDHPLMFDPAYPAGTLHNQDFNLCTRTLHTTYMGHFHAFLYDDDPDNYKGQRLENARYEHVFMGYNFIVQKVGVRASTSHPGMVDIDVTIEQVGVAPFYYDLYVSLECPGIQGPRTLPGVEDIIAQGEIETFRFEGIPNTPECLDSITLKLGSSYAFPGNPIKFAQQDGTVKLKLPTMSSTPQVGSTISPTDSPLGNEDGNDDPQDNGLVEEGQSHGNIGDNLIENSDMSKGYKGYWFGGQFDRLKNSDDGSIEYRRGFLSGVSGVLSYQASENMDYRAITPGSTFEITASVKLERLLLGRIRRGVTCDGDGCPEIKMVVKDSSGKLIAENDDTVYPEAWNDDSFNKITSTITLPTETEWDGIVGDVSIEITNVSPRNNLFLDDFQVLRVS